MSTIVNTQSASEKGPMPLTRYFSLAAAVILLISGTWLARHQSATVTEQLRDMVERQNAALTHVISKQIWPDFGSFVEGAGVLTAEKLRAHPTIKTLHKTLSTENWPAPACLSSRFKAPSGSPSIPPTRARLGRTPAPTSDSNRR